jgi:predicted metal-dependent hydrolase
MAPLDVVDYVVAHELAHLKERNHSKDFWRVVAQLKPNYQANRQWLKKNGVFLTLE